MAIITAPQPRFWVDGNMVAGEILSLDLGGSTQTNDISSIIDTVRIQAPGLRDNTCNITCNMTDDSDGIFNYLRALDQCDLEAVINNAVRSNGIVYRAAKTNFTWRKGIGDTWRGTLAFTAASGDQYAVKNMGIVQAGNGTPNTSSGGNGDRGTGSHSSRHLVYVVSGNTATSATIQGRSGSSSPSTNVGTSVSVSGNGIFVSTDDTNDRFVTITTAGFSGGARIAMYVVDHDI